MDESQSTYPTQPFGDPHENLWKRGDKTVLHHTPIFDLVSYQVTNPKMGKVRPYYVLETRNWVNVIAITPEKKIVLVRQYRHGLHEYSVEIPGGIVDEEGLDAPLISAKRELVEETGYTAKEWKLLGKVSGNPAIFNNWSYTYLALDAEKTSPVDWDEGEDIEIFLESIENVKKHIQSGEIHHSMMVAALSRYFLFEES